MGHGVQAHRALVAVSFQWSEPPEIFNCADSFESQQLEASVSEACLRQRPEAEEEEEEKEEDEEQREEERVMGSGKEEKTSRPKARDGLR